MATESITLTELRAIVSEELDDLVASGTATGGSTSTVVDTANLKFEDDQLIDAFVYINAGNASGNERLITDSSESSTNLTVAPNFSATVNTSSIYEVHSRFRVSRLDRAIKSAIRRFRYRLPRPIQKTTILTNNNVSNGLFTDWTSANADNWSSSGNNYTQNVTYLGDAISAGSLTYQAVVYSTSTAVKFEVTDGTTTVSDSHDGTGWNILKATINAKDDATVITLNITLDAGSSVTDTQESNNRIRGPYSSKLTWDTGVIAYVDSVYAPRGFAQHDYAVPTTLRSIHSVTLERSVDSINSPTQGRQREVPLERHAWQGRVGGDNPSKYIHFYWEPDDNVAVTLHGMGVVAIPSADSDTIEGNVAPYQDWACYELLRKADITEAAHYRRDALEALNLVRVAWPADSYIFDPN